MEEEMEERYFHYFMGHTKLPTKHDATKELWNCKFKREFIFLFVQSVYAHENTFSVLAFVASLKCWSTIVSVSHGQEWGENVIYFHLLTEKLLQVMKN